MHSIDVNVLLFAASPAAPEHRAARDAIERARSSLTGLAVQSTVAASFVRIATDPRAARAPLTAPQATSFLDAVLDAPRARITHPGPRHWSLFRQLCDTFHPRRGDVTDCWLAAAAMEADDVWVSFDRGFARFPGLRWAEPGT